MLEFSKTETAEAAADHRHTWVFGRAAGGKFLSDDLTAQTKGQILGGSPSASWATPKTRWDCVSLMCLLQHGGEETAEGGSRVAPGDRGKADGHKGEERVQTLGTAYRHWGLLMSPRRRSQLFLPRHADPCGKADPPVRGILEINHWGVSSLPNQEEMRNHIFGGKTKIIPNAEPKSPNHSVTDRTVPHSDSPSYFCNFSQPHILIWSLSLSVSHPPSLHPVLLIFQRIKKDVISTHVLKPQFNGCQTATFASASPVSPQTEILF